ncbi:hypothetical protein ES705_18527 [subsurface metagenome]
MLEILIPFKIEDLLIKPEIAGRIKLSEDMQQALSTLVGYDGSVRRLLRCSQGGVLRSATPRIQKITHISDTNPNYVWQGTDIKTTEVMILGHPLNTGVIWAKNDAGALTSNGWPLNASDIVNFGIDNLSNLHLKIPLANDIAIIAYTR